MIYAMLLCSGFGTRLGTLTENTPKPMLMLGEKPILEHTILHLKSFGIENIVINVHYQAEKITSYFEDGRKFGVKITYSYENELLGTSGSIKNVENILKQAETFLVLYGDIVTNQNYAEFLKFHKSKNATASIILHRRKKSNSYVIIDEENKVTKFLERPTDDELIREKINPDEEKWINSGLYCFDQNIFDFIKTGKSDFPKDVFPLLIKDGLLFGYPLSGYRCAIDTPERYYMIQSDYKNKLIF